MKTLQFKTNIKCGGCIAQVTPHLDAVAGIGQWNVDITNPQKVLTIEAETDASQVKKAVEQAGFRAELL